MNFIRARASTSCCSWLYGISWQVGPSYHARIGSPVSQWYIFNDFTINPIPPEEAVWFNLKWKIPCIICFTADKLPFNLEKLTFKVGTFVGWLTFISRCWSNSD